MDNKDVHGKVRRRDDAFSERLHTRIWQEVPKDENPYVAETIRCHGYSLDKLLQKKSFIEVLYLLFRGELPSSDEAQLLEHLMIAVINPGPRHPATRSAIAAGVGKTDKDLILPIALGTMSGSHNGAGEVEPAMRFLRQNRRKNPTDIARRYLENWSAIHDEHPIPGFGATYGGIDPVCQRHASIISKLSGCGAIMEWASEFVDAMKPFGAGWLNTGLAAAVLADLGFQPRYGAGMYQLFTAPGLLAHGIEYSNKAVTDFPFIPDNRYVIEDTTENSN